MKAFISVDIPDYQIGQEVSIYFKDTMMIKGIVQEPKTGHWIRMKAYEKWGCSECSTVFRFTFKEHDYCPNCGARMSEVENDL